ncbi:hypothetical protein COO60DRAFT_1577551 [Scenedesmus sp. NREL 46B-D3]|nr:hypothetical protein COO60DRAFT_1577551 [Scenedesmus sp. NREL 46B-D3]
MHPPLILEKHPICATYMEALVACHKEHHVSKWWGACNDAKFALTKCLAEEKRELRAERQERARQQHRELRRQAEDRAAAAAAAAAHLQQSH